MNDKADEALRRSSMGFCPGAELAFADGKREIGTEQSPGDTRDGSLDPHDIVMMGISSRAVRVV